MKQLRVEDIMSRVVLSLREMDTVQLGRLDMDVARVRHMPVTDARGALVGVVALTDLLQALAASKGERVAVRKVMSTHVKTIHEKAFARDAALTMLENKIGCLPVLGDGDRLVGIVTESDFLKLAADALARDGAEPLPAVN